MGNPCDDWSCVGYCFLPTDFLLMSDSMSPPCLVIDRGSSWTKLGFGGNFQPSFFLEKSPAEEDDFGHWFFSHLRVDPEQHACVLSEPSSSNPSARAECAETLFETYNVPALVLAPAPVLALYGTSQQQDRGLTGLVLDSGDVCTRAIPVIEGRVLHSCVRASAVAGGHITHVVEASMREKGEPLPADSRCSREIARKAKEAHCYICADVEHEQGPSGATSKELIRHLTWKDSSGKPTTFSVSQERFLGPELLFSPLSSLPATPIDELVDEAISATPIDLRRALYSNIVLSGGSMGFRNLRTRLQFSIQEICNIRATSTSKPINVTVRKGGGGQTQAAVWLGGSLLSTSPDFGSVAINREKYLEWGPNVFATLPSLAHGESAYYYSM